MHIPDGYLSPQTCAVTSLAALPFWAVASKRMKETLRMRQIPFLALSAAFCFVLMMFNVPIPGGTSGHAVGAVLIAILIGPWAACITVSAALIIQALVFGDGGITCIGANCLNMAVIMPFTGYAIYRLAAGKTEPSSPLRCVAAAMAGYGGLNIAAFTTAVMFGLQPLLFNDAAGRPLYAPYPLSITVPAIMIGHLTVFGFVEGAITALVVAWFQRTDPAMLGEAVPA